MGKGIIKQYNKATDTYYVFENESFWVPELKQTRTKRRCIGKIDKDTGEIIPTGGRGRKKKAPQVSADESIGSADKSTASADALDELTDETEPAKALKKEVRELRQEIAAQKRNREKLETRIRSLEEENWKLRNASDEAIRREKKRISALNGLVKDVCELADRVKQFSDEYDT